MKLPTIISMIIILGFFWGGFFFTLLLAIRKEAKKFPDKIES